MNRPDDPVAPPAGPDLPHARVRSSRWIGFVWAVPLAALAIVAFLGLRAYAERGLDIVITFDTAAGARVNDTKVIYKGLEAGYVRKIDISEDGVHVAMTVRMDRRSRPALTTATTFWLVGANPSISDLASVKAAVAGLSIGVAPSLEGEPTREFVGLDAPPLVAPGTPGTAYALLADELRTARAGSTIFFRGQSVGKVVSVKYEKTGRFRLGVFIFEPYAALVGPRALFWVSSPLQVSLTDKGISAGVEHAGSILDGAIELDIAGSRAGDVQSPAGTEFTLYRSRSDAESGPTGPAVAYTFVFTGAAGEMVPGAPVRLLGFPIGEVTSVTMQTDARSGTVSARVTANLYPRKMQIGEAAPPADAAGWRSLTDAAVDRLLASGYRARLLQSPPLVGPRLVSLERVPGARKAALIAGAQPRIPAADAGDGASVDTLIGQAHSVLAKFERLPIDAIGRDVRQLTGKLNALAGSPSIRNGLSHFESTLAQADRLMRDVTPKVGPLVAKLDRAADELTGTVAAARKLLGGTQSDGSGGSGSNADVPGTLEQLDYAARSLRTLADYLRRHPEALLRGTGAAAAAPSRTDR